MKRFEEENINENLSQEELKKAKEFFEFRITANQDQLDRVNFEFLNCADDKKEFLQKSKSGYEAKIITAQNVLTKINSLIV